MSISIVLISLFYTIIHIDTVCSLQSISLSHNSEIDNDSNSLLSTSTSISNFSATSVNLQVEYLNNPIGIDIKYPRFSWYHHIHTGNVNVNVNGTGTQQQ